jgi:CHAT domain-containing protein
MESSGRRCDSFSSLTRNAAALISEFYRQLQAPTVSKAMALQRAQLKLLNDPVYDHPAYWSSFLLINNWL